MANLTNMSPQQFSLRWNNYTNYIAGAFDALRYEEDFVDVTLCCEGRKIRAHKILLSACSPYFKEVFKENPCQHPVIIFKNVRHSDLMSIVEFMYQGEVSVAQDQLPSFLHTAELLSIRGLTDSSNEPRQQQQQTGSSASIAQQLLQTQGQTALLEKPTTITTADSLFLTLPSNSTIVHQPKLLQAQIQTPIISKTIIKAATTEMPALTTPSGTITVPIAQSPQQQQSAIAKIQVQTSQQQQAAQQSQQVQVQMQQVPQVVQQVQQVQQVQHVQQVQQVQQVTQQSQQQQSHLQQQIQQPVQTQATTLQEVVDSVVQPKKKKIKIQQIITSQSAASTVPAMTVAVTATASGQSGDSDMFEPEAYTIATTKVDASRTQQEQQEQTVETYTESAQSSGAALKIEMPEFISVGEAMTTGSANNNSFMQESYELVGENIEDKDVDDDEMAQDNIEIEGSDIDMSRIFQGSSDEQKSNILQVSLEKIEITTEDKLYKCPECRRSFCSTNAMKRHRQAKHTNSQVSFMCALCDARFKTKWSLSTHKSKYHRGQSTSFTIRSTDGASSAATIEVVTGESATGSSAPSGASGPTSAKILKTDHTGTSSQEAQKRASSGGMVTRIKSQIITPEDP
ncbi:longitudinals lacking protein, isoforms H/M/V-like isoform X2 [Anopheles cruzii]|uniref:longitudinals lacking protein, isoforms H/M/V-like isoform X2 n=1 Tax=Anopheles cruzii TaxID=68878 RepID=UPI0022EC2D03|nr:longitudinals lacking protein, isoforms H/M/V-like isoform X2 [Anopheles cruzii]